MKKIFIISTILLVIVLIFLGIYNFAFKKNTPAVLPMNKIETIIQPTKESIVEKKITQVSDKAVLGPVVDKKTGEIKYYDAATGIVWKTNEDGKNIQQVTTITMLGLKNVLWSTDQNKVVTVLLKENKNAFYVYDYLSQHSTLLKDNLDTVAWDNIGSRIFYKYFDAKSGQRTLNISNPDGSNWQKLADISARNLSIVSIPLTATVSYWNYPSAKEETLFQSIGVTGGEPKIILNGKYGADYLWSPSGKETLVSSLVSKEDNTLTLGIVSLDGKYQNLSIPTLVSKCAWSKDGKSIFYALPGNIPATAIMPDDYQENKFNTEDTFWRLDLTTGNKERIIEANEIGGKYDSSEVFLSMNEKYLFFVNKIDRKLYRINL